MQVEATGQSDGLRGGLRTMWASVAGAWDERSDFVDARGADITEHLAWTTTIGLADRVLEVACGPGGVGLALAERVGPEGRVVMTDVVPEMTAIAARRAQARGLSNVEFRERDLEAIAEPDDSFDVVVCREGLMLVVDPVRAVSEIRRVLRPGGRAGIAVWGPRERNPWLGALFDAVSATLGAPVPPPGIPGPFSLDDRDRFTRVLTEGGLLDVTVAEIEIPMEIESFEMWWRWVTGLAGPLAMMLAALPAETRESIRDRARESLAAYDSGNGLVVPGVTLVASGRA